MAVAQTGAIFKALTIDGESSRTYGVYITGQAVYNAPQREVEMISIAGRNGKFALDKGRFENIEVTYPAGIYADTEEDFAEAVSNFRNYLCSRDGYVRIEDEYNPNEYRMGVYKSGLEVTPKLLKAGEFDITFDCKPQRWLKSGETAITVSSGDAVTNPTLFESSPMLEVIGVGTIGIGGDNITVTGERLGKIQLSNKSSAQSVTLNVVNLLTGDSIYPKLSSTSAEDITFAFDSSSTLRLRTVETTENVSVSYSRKDSRELASVKFNSLAFEKGTASTVTGTAVLLNASSASPSFRATITITAEYDGVDTVTLNGSVSGVPSTVTTSVLNYHHAPFYGDSTKIVTPEPMYIALAIGEAYGEEGGQTISLNNMVTLPSDLPKLSSGANTITFDNTITDLKIVPRWWKV